MSRLVILRVAFWAATFFSLYMAWLPHPPQVPGTHGDKVQHMIAFATLAMLGSAAYPRISLVLIAVALSAFGAAIELIQTIPAISRDGSFADWVADTAAAAVVLLLVARTRSRMAGSVGQKG
jgi:VanZ family protein